MIVAKGGLEFVPAAAEVLDCDVTQIGPGEAGSVGMRRRRNAQVWPAGNVNDVPVNRATQAARK